MARIRASGILRKPRTWPPPILPTPMCPIVMRSLGGVVCDRAMTCRGTIIGATAAAVAARRKSRRFTCERGAGGNCRHLSSHGTRASGLTPGGAVSIRAAQPVFAIRKQGFKKFLGPFPRRPISGASETARFSVAGSVNRRTFTKAVLTGLGAAAMPQVTAGAASQPAATSQSSAAKQLRIGCTSLVWGVFPRAPEPLETAVRDMSELGYKGFETFGQVVEDWDKKGTLEKLISQSQDSAHLCVRPPERDRSIGSQERNRHDPPLGQHSQEVRCQLHRDRGRRRQTHGLRLRRAPCQHRRRR